MVIEMFPPVEEADSDGLLAIGGDLEVESLLLAYSSGIFPWPHNERRLAWFAPPKRAIILLDKFHIAKSLAKERNRRLFKFSINQAFQEVITECRISQNRVGQSGTWITKAMLEGYINFHRAGYAHSFECWEKDNLVGGVYGISIGRMFAGESMFYLKPNASKLALWFLIEHLRKQNVAWMDCQVINPNIARFGAVQIDRNIYHELLSQSVNQPSKLTFPSVKPLSW